MEHKIDINQLIIGKPEGFTRGILNGNYVVTVSKIGDHLSLCFQAEHDLLRGMKAEVFVRDFFEEVIINGYQLEHLETTEEHLQCLVNNFTDQQECALKDMIHLCTKNYVTGLFPKYELTGEEEEEDIPF